jgi:hypothetical protein
MQHAGEHGKRLTQWISSARAEQRGWNGEAQRLRCPEVDEELELGRGFNRKIRGLVALQYLIDINSGAAADR